MIDILAAVIGFVLNAILLVVLLRWRPRAVLFVVVAFALASLYTADRVLPRTLVDGWPNFDAARSPALRPWFVVPDLVIAGGIAMLWRGPRVARLTLVVAASLALAAAVGITVGAAHTAIPLSGALFWATVPLRGILVVLLVDRALARYGSEPSLRQVLTAAVLGGSVIALEILAVSGAKAAAALLGYDLADVWSGFDWTRPNLPGWNNNLAASAIALGTAALVLAPKRIELPTGVRLCALLVMLVAVVVTEYRTGILVVVASLAIRAGLAVYGDRLRHWARMPAVAAGGASALLVGVALLGVTAVLVPRLGDLNPVAYLSLGVSADAPEEVPKPSAEPGDDTSSASRGQILRTALGVWMREPVTGAGLGAWEFDRPIEPSFLQRQITPHTGYAWVLADLGLLGFVGFFLLPALLVLWRRPPLDAFALAVVVAVLEVSIVGIAHSRYAVLYWALLGVIILGNWARADVHRSRSAPGPTHTPTAAPG